MSERFDDQRDAFLRALQRLRDVLAQNENEFIRDAIIQRFEFTFEMAWRSLFRLLIDRGERVGENASATLTAAHAALLIDDAERWHRVRIARNKTSHTYDEALAIEVSAMIRADAMPAFEALADRLGTP